MILFCVNVPVLSVHRISIAPKFWIALSRLTIALRRAITTAPLARLVVTIIGSISGVCPTATETANRSDRSEERRVGKECRSLCDWSSDVCSSDLAPRHHHRAFGKIGGHNHREYFWRLSHRHRNGKQERQIGRASCRERV